ncbi:MAG: alcohol dehydrogenase catalytic domain-containing protein, partial [Actinomycetota bacterium]
MRAARYTEHGGPDVLTVVDVPDPEPGPGDVVVSVEAASLNRLDVVQRNGWFTLDGFTLPHISGMDVAGTVDAVGSEVDGVAVGDRVVIDPSMSGVADNSKLAGR